MAEKTPRLDLDDFAPGDKNWDHSDAVNALDEHAIVRGPIADRPAEGDYDDELFHATDQNITWRWDADVADWVAAGGTGSESQPIPGTTHMESAEVDEQVTGTEPVANVKYYGAVGDGSTDDSAAVQSAVDAVKSTGGIVFFPAGEYIFEGVELPDNVMFVGCGSASVCKPPATQSAHMLSVPDGTGVMSLVGAMHLHFEGTGSTTYDAIDLSSASKIEVGQFFNLIIGQFRHGISGSQNDRDIRVSSCRIRNNVVGYYVNENHPLIVDSRFVGNTTGLGGGIFDALVTSTKFTGNDYGVRPLDGGKIARSNFTNCMWHGNSVKDLVINSGNTISNGLFRPGSEADRGVEVKGPRTRVTGVLFGTGGGASYSDAAVVLDTAAQVAIENNNFYSVGTAAKVTSGAGSNKVFSFSNNTINADAPIFIQSSSLTLFTSTINNNRAFVAYDPTTDGAVYQVGGAAGSGFQFCNNTIYGNGSEATGGDYLNASDAGNAIIKNNRAHRVTGQTLTGTPAANTDNVET